VIHSLDRQFICTIYEINKLLIDNQQIIYGLLIYLKLIQESGIPELNVDITSQEIYEGQ